MNCHLFDALLDEYIDHALDAETEAALDAHLIKCAECAAAHERERSAATIVAGSAGARAYALVSRRGFSRGLPQAVPSSVRTRVAGGLHECGLQPAL